MWWDSQTPGSTPSCDSSLRPIHWDLPVSNEHLLRLLQHLSSATHPACSPGARVSKKQVRPSRCPFFWWREAEGEQTGDRKEKPPIPDQSLHESFRQPRFITRGTKNFPC